MTMKITTLGNNLISGGYWLGPISAGGEQSADDLGRTSAES